MASNTTTKIIDWKTLVKKQKDYKQKDPPEYRFSNSRTFDRGENRGVYKT